MIKNKVRSPGFVILIVAIIFSISLAAFYSNQKKVDVRLGYLTGDIHQLAYFVANSKGFYEDEGISVESYKFSNGGAVMNAFESSTKSIDMAYLGFAPAVVHRFNTEGADITVLAAANVNGTSIVVKNDGTINTIADLKGKKIAIPTRNNMQDFILRMAVDSEPSLNYEDITTIIMSVSNMKLELEAGGIDGYVAWEPFCAQAVTGENPAGKYLINSSQLWSNHPCCVLAADNSFLSKHSDIVQKVVNAHIRATNFINNKSNYDEVVSIAETQLNIPKEVVKASLFNVGYVYAPEISKMVEFVNKLVTFGTVSMDSTLLPENVKSESDFIDFFVSTQYIS